TFDKWPTIHPTEESERIISAPTEFPLVLVVGGKAYGPSEPLVRDGNSMSVIVPTADIIANPTMRVVTLFADDNHTNEGTVSCSLKKDLEDYRLPERADKFVYLGPA